MGRQAPEDRKTEVWFVKIERAVHRVRQLDRSLTVAQALSRALEDDAEARVLFDRYCGAERTAKATTADAREGEQGERTGSFMPRPSGSSAGVLLEVARLRSLKSGTDYAEEFAAVMNDYPNLASLYKGGNRDEN